MEMQRKLDDNIIEIENSFERFHLYNTTESKLNIANIYDSYREGATILRDMLNVLESNKREIKRSPSDYIDLVKGYVKGLTRMNTTVGIVTRDSEMKKYVRENEICTMLSNFQQLDDETKKFLTDIGKKDEMWLMLR